MIDPFNCQEQIANNEVRVLRQSTLGTADTCHKRIEFGLDPSWGYQTGPARAIGTAYHAGLETFYNGILHGEFPYEVDALIQSGYQSLDDEIVTAGDNWEWDDVAPNLEIARMKISNMLGAYFEQEQEWPVVDPSAAEFDQWTVLGVEEMILMPLRPGWVMRGQIDLILQDPNGWHRLVDHKSAGKPWRKDKHLPWKTNQPAWYVYWWAQAWAASHDGELPPGVDFTFDVMTYDSKFERRQALVRPLDIETVRYKADQLATLIECGGPFLPNTDSFLCSSKYCDYFQACPFGEQWQKVELG